MASSRLGRSVSIILASVFLFSSFAAIFLVIKESKDADQASKEQSAQVAGKESCQVSTSTPNSANIPPSAPILSGPVNELQVEDLAVGGGETVALDDCITVNYRLTLADGSEVEGNNTFSVGKPIAFQLSEGGLIEGWIKGLPGAKVGGLRRLIIPASLGYGANSAGSIPPFSDLVFDIEILDTKH